MNARCIRFVESRLGSLALLVSGLVVYDEPLLSWTDHEVNPSLRVLMTLAGFNRPPCD